MGPYPLNDPLGDDLPLRRMGSHHVVLRMGWEGPVRGGPDSGCVVREEGWFNM